LAPGHVAVTRRFLAWRQRMLEELQDRVKDIDEKIGQLRGYL
jgi:hypothetical protein